MGKVHEQGRSTTVFSSELVRSWPHAVYRPFPYYLDAGQPRDGSRGFRAFFCLLMTMRVYSMVATLPPSFFVRLLMRIYKTGMLTTRGK